MSDQWERVPSPTEDDGEKQWRIRHVSYWQDQKNDHAMYFDTEGEAVAVAHIVNSAQSKMGLREGAFVVERRLSDAEAFDRRVQEVAETVAKSGVPIEALRAYLGGVATVRSASQTHPGGKRPQSKLAEKDEWFRIALEEAEGHAVDRTERETDPRSRVQF